MDESVEVILITGSGVKSFFCAGRANISMLANVTRSSSTTFVCTRTETLNRLEQTPKAGNRGRPTVTV